MNQNKHETRNDIQISIIVPCFYSSNNIDKLLSSIKFSEEIMYEIILIDDKSGIKELNKLEKKAQEYNYTKVFENNTGSKGAGVCRNIGMQYATGKWLLFADSDDHFLPKLNELISRYLDIEEDLVYFKPTSQDQFGNTGTRHLTYLQYFENYENNWNELDLRYKMPVVWSRMFKSEFVKNNGLLFDSTLVSNDRMFSLKTGHRAKKIKVLKDTIYSWDYNSESLTMKMPQKNYEVNLEVFIRANNFLKENLDHRTYTKIAESATKMLAMSLFRYKYGLKYSIKILRKLLENGVPLVFIRDLKRIFTFFKNNDFYSK